MGRVTQEPRRKIFFTSDWHIGHHNCLDFDNRPFKDLQQMHTKLRNNFNATVPEDGVTYVLGDVGMGNVDLLKEFVQSLNGTKILVIGNHDAGINRMYNIGFTAVLHNCSLLIAKHLVTLSHCPKRGVYREDTTDMWGSLPSDNWHKEEKHKLYSVSDTDQFHLHGHIHSTKKNSKLGMQWDIGVVGNSYTPVSMSNVESWIARYNQNK